jgi:hypothetical protein
MDQIGSQFVDTWLGYILAEVRVFESRGALMTNMSFLHSEVIFMSGARDSRTLMVPIKSSLVKLIFTTGGTRQRVLGDWVATQHKVAHAAAGGVTDHILYVQCWRPAGSPRTSLRLSRCFAQIPRNMSTILNSTAEGGRERQAPKLTRVEPPRVMQLAPGLYHGFGHYPLGVRPTPTFLVPSVFTKSKWARWVLTLHERLLMLDFPEVQHSCLTTQMMQDIILAAIPGKSLLAVWAVTGGGETG